MIRSNKTQCPKCEGTNVVIKMYPRGKRWMRCTTTERAGIVTEGCGFGWTEYR